MLQCFSDQRYRRYTPLTWIDLPEVERGMRQHIPADARKFIVEATVEGSGVVPAPFPTQRRRNWQLTSDKEQGKMVMNVVRLKVTIPDYPVSVLRWQGPWMANARALDQNGRLLRVTDGTAEITRLLYSACPLVASNK